MRYFNFLKFLFAVLIFFHFTVFVSEAYPSDCNTKLLLNKEYVKKVIPYLKKAKQEVIISAYMWCCNPQKYYSLPCKMLSTVLELVKKGIKVTVILDKDIKSDSQCNLVTSEIFKHTLLRKYDNLKIYFDSPVVRSHQKLVLIDGKYSFIGSHNITQSAMKYNNEVSVFIKSEKIFNKLKNYIKNIIKDSKKIY